MNHIGLHLAKAKAMGKPLEVAVAQFCDPAMHVAACTVRRSVSMSIVLPEGCVARQWSW